MAKTTPYNPLTGPLPSLDLIRRRARRRAHRETVAAAAAIPQDMVVKQANDSLIASLRSTADQYGGLVKNAGQSYADATAGAKSAQAGAMAQLGAAPGTAAPADTRGGLLGAMAANNMAPMTGAIVGAQQALPGKIEALHGKRDAILKGEDAAFEKYYQAGLDDALRNAAAQNNAAMSSAQLQQTGDFRNAQLALGADRNAISRDRNDIARSRLEQALSGVSDKDMRAAIKKAVDTVNRVLGGKATANRVTSGKYHFTLPAIPDTPGDPDLGTPTIKGKPAVKIVVQAANGNEAKRKLTEMMAGKITAGLVDKRQWDPKMVASYYDGDATREDITTKVALPADRQRALAMARRILEGAGFTPQDALKRARLILGPPPKHKKKKTKTKTTSTPGSTGIG